MIDISDLVFSYRKNSVADGRIFGMQVGTLAVPTGVSAALVGPSGSGKTTLLGLIAGTLRPASGRVCVNNQEISNFDEAQLGRFRLQNVGQVFQTFELLNYLTVLENVMLPWYIDGHGDKAAIRERARSLLQSVGLENKADSRPSELSQGEQQRVAVSRAMLNNPPLLLADEPTGNLDQENKQNVVDLLRDQARRNKSTLLMVTHDESLLDKFDVIHDIKSIAGPASSEAF
jgi:ABC-type lipoprotein export system ATPase subunit